MRHTLLPFAFIALAACGGGSDVTTPPGGTGGTPGGAGSTSNAISVTDNSFGPSATTVTAGTTVTWTWNGRNTHNVTFDDGAASVNQTGGTFARSFAAAGTFPYHCTVHGAGMSGTVTVR